MLPLIAPRLPCSQADAERRRAAGLQEDLKNLKEQHFQIQKQVEQEEEYITNKLTKRLNQLKKEKQTLANEVEQEEEFLVSPCARASQPSVGQKLHLSTLAAGVPRLTALLCSASCARIAAADRQEASSYRREGVHDVAERDAQVNNLQKRLAKIAAEKADLERRLEAETECAAPAMTLSWACLAMLQLTNRFSSTLICLRAVSAVDVL